MEIGGEGVADALGAAVDQTSLSKGAVLAGKRRRVMALIARRDTTTTTLSRARDNALHTVWWLDPHSRLVAAAQPQTNQNIQPLGHLST